MRSEHQQQPQQPGRAAINPHGEVHTHIFAFSLPLILKPYPTWHCSSKPPSSSNPDTGALPKPTSTSSSWHCLETPDLTYRESQELTAHHLCPQTSCSWCWLQLPYEGRVLTLPYPSWVLLAPLLGSIQETEGWLVLPGPSPTVPCHHAQLQPHVVLGVHHPHVTGGSDIELQPALLRRPHRPRVQQKQVGGPAEEGNDEIVMLGILSPGFCCHRDKIWNSSKLH